MKLDPKKTACLTLDLQEGIIQMLGTDQRCLANAAKIVELARKNQFHLIHVGLGFNEGYPEIPEESPFGDRLKPMKLFIKGTDSSEFHPSIYQLQDLIVYKQRVGGFSENELHMILRAKQVENLILFGIATSGIVLSTLRRAFDLDYKCFVIKDACMDRDPEVHRVLTEKVFAAQATVLDTNTFIEKYG